MRFGAPQKTCLVLSMLLLCAACRAEAAEPEDNQVLGLFSDEQPAAPPSPIPRPVSRIAENVTVITAEDILRLNAHTLTEVLQTVPGIQLDFGHRTPGTFNFFSIQGALNTTVLVLIDGVRQNDFAQNTANPGMIPVQQIERIEVVKGAASGSWGSALGGVINVVTKSPDPEAPVSGMVSGSVGSRFTADSRGELGGTVNRFGYYLTAGRLRSDGLSPGSAVTMDNLYGKLSYTLTGRGTVTAGASRAADGAGEGEGVFPRLGFLKQESDSRHSYGFLRLQQPLGERYTLDILGYGTGRNEVVETRGRDRSGSLFELSRFRLREATRGVNAGLCRGDSRNNVTVGAEYGHGETKSKDEVRPSPSLNRGWDSFAAYLNATFSLGELSVLPGIRFDSTGISGDQTSYSLGLSYRLAEKTLLRAYAARGFSLPILFVDTGNQRVRTVQAGVETGAVPFLWLKGTYFFNDLSRAQTVGSVETAVAFDQTRQGFELEGRTTPWFGFALSGGYTYLYARDHETGKRLKTDGRQSLPSHVYKVALNYDDSRLGLRGAVTGSGVVWNAPPVFPAASTGMMWDLSLNWKPGLRLAPAPELFFSAHNLFNAAQTTNTIQCPSARRWYEGGARWRF